MNTPPFLRNVFVNRKLFLWHFQLCLPEFYSREHTHRFVITEMQSEIRQSACDVRDPEAE